MEENKIGLEVGNGRKIWRLCPSSARRGRDGKGRVVEGTKVDEGTEEGTKVLEWKKECLARIYCSWLMLLFFLLIHVVRVVIVAEAVMVDIFINLTLEEVFIHIHLSCYFALCRTEYYKGRNKNTVV